MTYRIKILPRAEADVENIYQWLRQRSPPGADRWLEAFERAVQGLTDAPTGFGRASESQFVDAEVYQVLFKTARGRTYRALFVVTHGVVQILRVRGPGQRDLQADELDDAKQ